MSRTLSLPACPRCGHDNPDDPFRQPDGDHLTLTYTPARMSPVTIDHQANTVTMRAAQEARLVWCSTLHRDKETPMPQDRPAHPRTFDAMLRAAFEEGTRHGYAHPHGEDTGPAFREWRESFLPDPEDDEEPRPVGAVGVVHVDWDDPRVIRTGPESFMIFPDENEPNAVLAPLSDGWQQVGYTTDDGAAVTVGFKGKEA